MGELGRPGRRRDAKLFPCLGFAGTIFDTHAEDEDWKELKTALWLQGPGEKGYGIPRDGMMVVDNDGNMEAPGKALVCFDNIGGRVMLIETEK